MNQQKDIIRDARVLGTPKMLLLGLQHMFAMFGATILVPILVNSYFQSTSQVLSVQVTLFCAGFGTLFFHLCTKFKVPAFLGSSFAFLGGFSSVAALDTGIFANMADKEKLQYACGGIVVAGLLYLLFDLDGTLLQSDKTISTRTLSALKKCRGNDILIGVSTSRSEQNSLVFLNELMPDILISSGGALVKYKTEYIYRAEFSEEETNVMIDMARNICGNDCEITIDTIDAHYWNYKIDPKKLDKSWGDSIYTDFSDFNECSLKMCVEIFNQDKADKLARSLSDCDCIRFSDGFWYKFTKKNVTKENAIMKITEVCGFSTDSIIAFGDDYADIGMLELCGTGVAMGNAIDEVKERADIVIGSNDEDGIAGFIENEIL